VADTATLDPAAFVRAHTELLAPPLVPEIRLHQATEVTALWQATEAVLDALELPPPFWAFAWAGGQALARYILDNPAPLRGKRVLDFATGGGLVAIAAATAGAARVTACDVDRFAIAAAGANAAANGVTIDLVHDDLVGGPNRGWDMIFAGDICYEQRPAERMIAWLRRLAGDGTPVYLGDPMRTFLPRSGLDELARYSVPTTRAIEDTDVRNARVWRVLP
jgi:predicted nicotinamide N-methyase